MRKRALVIGNDAYAKPYGLATCVNDAKAFAATLRRMRFEVTMAVDVTGEEFNARFAQFSEDAGLGAAVCGLLELRTRLTAAWD